MYEIVDEKSNGVLIYNSLSAVGFAGSSFGTESKTRCCFFTVSDFLVEVLTE
jgi:hypothetical protein